MILETVNPTQLVLQVQAQNPDGTPKTALASAAVRVYHISGSEVVDLASTPLVQVGGSSVWRYIWTPGSLPSNHYFAEYTLTDNDGALFVGVEDIDIRDIAKQVDLAFVKQVEQGRWKIIDQQMIFYDSDALTPLLIFNLKDVDGNPSNISVFERVPV